MSCIKKTDCPIVKKMFQKSIAKELLSVQPMNSQEIFESFRRLAVIKDETDSIKNQRICREAIVKHLNDGGKPIGQIECPICHGKLTYSCASYNNHINHINHIHAKCEGGCAWWVE